MVANLRQFWVATDHPQANVAQSRKSTTFRECTVHIRAQSQGSHGSFHPRFPVVLLSMTSPAGIAPAPLVTARGRASPVWAKSASPPLGISEKSTSPQIGHGQRLNVLDVVLDVACPAHGWRPLKGWARSVRWMKIKLSQGASPPCSSGQLHMAVLPAAMGGSVCQGMPCKS